MSKKKAIGIAIGVIGIALSIYALNGMKRIKEAKGNINTATSPFSGTMGGDVAHNTLTAQASQYDTPVKVMLVGGILMIIVGGMMTFCCCKKGAKHK